MKLLTRFFSILCIVTIIIGFKTPSQAQTKGELIVNFAYAPEKIRQGDTWKIYLSVIDPEGNMHQVVCRIEQPGESYFKPSLIYLKRGMEKQFTGYFALYTQTFYELDDFVLALSILDRAGNVRKTLRFPLEFDGGEPMKPLPPDIERDLNRRIGMIDVDWNLGGGF
ncbi:MAG: hypothetical protein ABSG71_17415 [Thermodesulfobacteriota bacterium]|jgi:hypothetical protein